MKALVARAAPLAAIALLVVNDHVLKHAYPGVITGKLSDFAGLFFFPFLLLDLVGLVRPEIRTRADWLLAACLATGGAFMAVKLWAPANAAYAGGLGMLQWPFRAIVSLVHHGSASRLRPVRLVMDATDVVALVSLVAAYRYGAAPPRAPERPVARPSR